MCGAWVPAGAGEAADPLTTTEFEALSPCCDSGGGFEVDSWFSYLLLHAVLSHRVTALGKHLSSIFCQGENVLEGSTGPLLSKRGEVAGRAQGVRGA